MSVRVRTSQTRMEEDVNIYVGVSWTGTRRYPLMSVESFSIEVFSGDSNALGNGMVCEAEPVSSGAQRILRCVTAELARSFMSAGTDL